MRYMYTDSIMNLLDRVIKSRKETKMVKRGKRIVSKILCATVLFTMTAVPGAVFAESDEALEAADTGSKAVETEAPDSATEAAQTEQKETAPAAQKEEAKAPAQESQAAPQTQAAKSQAKAVDTQAARAATGVKITTTANKTTFCTGTKATLTAEIQKQSGVLRYSYQWYKDGQKILRATKSTYNVTASGTYTVEVTEHVIGTNPTFKANVKIAFVDHDLEWKQNGGYHWQECKNCNNYKSSPEKHKLTKTARQDSTCTETGHEAYWTCSKCNIMFSDENGTNMISEPVVISPKHTLTGTQKKDATCTENGYEAYWTCSVCQGMFADPAGTNPIDKPVVIPAAHKLEAVAKKDATCTEDGYKAYWKCNVCDRLFADEQAITPIETPEVISATGHNVVWHYAGNNAEKCAKYCTTCKTFLSEPIDHDIAYKKTDDTTHMKYCERCNSNLKSENHNWEADYTIDTPATCTTAGSKSIHCKNCDATTSEQTIDMLPHTLTKTEAKAATCTEPGHDAYWTCEICKQRFADENGKELIPEIIPTDPLGHDLKLVEKVDATCLKDGHEAYWECKTCGKIFADEACQNELEAPVVIKATGHKFGDWKVVKDPTVGEAGMKERVCEKCGYTETEAIPALDAAKEKLAKATADKANDDSAKTGDDMNVALYSLLALLAASGAVGVAYRRRTTEK